jgi:hypothetical protein
MGLHSFLEARGIAIHTYNVFNAGVLFPFQEVFLRARRILPGCMYEYFSEQDGYDFLPFKHVQLYKDGYAPDSDSLLWVCRYCHFWCEIFDPLIMERHLCVDCVDIPPSIKTSFRLTVFERSCTYMKQLFNIDIE